MNRLRGPHFFGQMEATVLAPDEIEEWQMLESWLHCQNGKITKAYIGLHPTQEPFKKTRPSAEVVGAVVDAQNLEISKRRPFMVDVCTTQFPASRRP